MNVIFKGNILTATRIAIYALLFIALLAALCYLYFWHWSYPLLQLIGSWQDSSVILQVLIGSLAVLALTHFLFSGLFPNEVQVQLDGQQLLVHDRFLFISIPLSELKRVNFLYRHQQLCRITIYDKKRRYVNVGDIIRGLSEAQFQPFIGELKSTLQKKFSFEVSETYQQASKMNNRLYDLYVPAYDLKGKRKKNKRWIIAGIFGWLAVVGLSVYSLILWMDDSENGRVHHNVHDQDTLMSGLDSDGLDIRKIDQYLLYSTDHQSRHFVNDIAFPDRVVDPIWGRKSTVDLSHLRLIQEKNSSSAHLIFFDGRRMYYYDEKQKAFYCIKTFPRQLTLRKLGERIFTDGTHVYFTERRRLGTRHRSGSLNSIGIQTTLYRLKNVLTTNFKKVENGDSYEIFSDGERQYVSVHGYGNRLSISSGLYYLVAGQVDNVYSLTKTDLADIHQKEKIFHINSRNYHPKSTR